MNKNTMFQYNLRKEKGASLRQSLLADIGNAVRRQGGCLRLTKPVTLFVDDLFGEMPITVRYVKECVSGANEFEINPDYTTIHLDDNSLKQLFKSIK